MENKNGFTLIEVIISLSLLSIILLVVGNLINYNFREYNSKSADYEYKLSGRYAINKVTNEIKKNSGTSFDSGQILSDDLSILVNSNKNDNTGNIFYYYEPDRYGLGDGYGELRNSNNQVIARDIKEFLIESIDVNLVKITVIAGKENNSKLFELVSYVRLYS